MRPPTALLPRLRAEPPLPAIADAVAELALIYAPLGTAAPDYDDPLDVLRADPTERNYAMDWLQRVVSSGMPWAGAEARHTVEQAARILEQSTSALETGELLREFSFPMSGPARVTVTVRDAPVPLSDSRDEQGAKAAASAVGVQTYASSVIMADLLAAKPHEFHAALRPGTAPRPLSVYELGAGTGIVGIVAAQLLASCAPDPAAASVVITDYHVDVMANLEHNLSAHQALGYPSVAVRSSVLDWRDCDEVRTGVASRESVYGVADGGAAAPPLPPPQSVSLVLAADVIYDPSHAEWLVSAIWYLLAQPDTDAHARAHVMSPVRIGFRLAGLYATLDAAVRQVGPRNGYTLALVGQHRLPRRRGLGRQDEVEYVWSELGWLA